MKKCISTWNMEWTKDMVGDEFAFPRLVSGQTIIISECQAVYTAWCDCTVVLHRTTQGVIVVKSVHPN